MKFWFQVLATTAVLLALYLGFLRLTGLRARYAEANVVANEIKWQQFEQQRDAGLIILGSSIAGRLPAEALTDENGAAVNLSLDGSSAAFGASLLLEMRVFPRVLVIEANTLTLPASSNEQTLRSSFRGLHSRLARGLPFLRAENRPVSIAYSRLKQRSDRRHAGPRPAPSLDQAAWERVLESSQATTNAGAIVAPSDAQRWRTLLQPFVERGSRVVLVMLPEGGRDRTGDYAVARALAASGIPFLDLKGSLPESEFMYSDGIHLVRPAAEQLAAFLDLLLRRLHLAAPDPSAGATREGRD